MANRALTKNVMKIRQNRLISVLFFIGLLCTSSLGMRSLQAQAIRWTKTLPFHTEALAFNPGSKGQEIYAAPSDSEGIWKSNDGGYHWVHLLRGPNPLELGSSALISQIFVLPSDTSVVLVGSSNPRVGMYRTSDGGKNWTRVLEEFSTGGETIFELSGATGDTVYCGQTSYGTLWRSVDLGVHWDSIVSNGSRPDLCTITPQPGSSWIFLSGSGGGVISRTVDGGAHWTATFSADSANDFTDVPRILFDPTNGREVWATIFSSPKVSLLHSTNGGISWNAIPRALDEWALEIDPANPKRLWIGRFSALDPQGPHFEQTTDGGNTWTTEDSASAGGFKQVVDIWKIKYDSTSGRLAVATSNGVFIGETKQQAVSAERSVNAFAITPNPARSVVHISSLQNTNERLRIVDLLGRVWWSSESLTSAGDRSITVVGWPAGVYTLLCETTQGSVASRFLVVR
jgi:photosystem II stability/assembly factor-like uncharacterized protein